MQPDIPAKRFAMQWYWLIVGILCTWRVSHLLSAEDGPFEMFARLRELAGRSLGQLMDCFYCLSLWVAAPLALVLGDGAKHSLLLWLSFSGGAILLERFTGRASTHAPVYFEHAEVGGDHVMLRQSESGSARTSAGGSVGD